MSKKNDFATVVPAALEARAVEAEKALNTGLAKKLRYEAGILGSEAVAKHFDGAEVSPNTVTGMAIYAIQKVRKLGRSAAGIKMEVDPYTIAILRAAQKLAADSVPFTPQLVQATLSADIEVTDSPAITKISKLRQAYSPGTARSQSNTSKQALVAAGMAKIDLVDGRKCLTVDMAHPLVARALGDGPKAEAPAKAK